MKSSRLTVLAVTGVALFSFSGCAQTGDVAIKVDDTTYSAKDVDLFTDFQCDYFEDAGRNPEAAGQLPQISRAQARSQVATFLVSTALDARIAEKADAKADPDQVKQTMDSLAPVIKKSAKGEDRERLTSLISEYLDAQLAIQAAIVAQIGETTLQQLGQEQANQVLTDALNTAQAAAAKASDIDIDPVYGLSDDGLQVADDPSLSVRVTKFAKDASAAQATETFLGDLPSSQRCG